MAQNLSALAVGALVKDTGTLYNGKPIIWRIVDKNHSGYPANSVTLMTDKIVSLKCFDAAEPRSSNEERRSMGNNRYIYSNIRRWLNSSAGTGAWYTAQHYTDAPPTISYTNCNAYESEQGFLYGFSANLRAALLGTTHTVGKSSADGGGTETCVDEIFLPSCTEMGLSGNHVCGVKLAAFGSDASRQAYPTAECVRTSEQTSGLSASQCWDYSSCDAVLASPRYIGRVHLLGELNNNLANNGYGGVRPLCNLPSATRISDTPDADGAYTVIWNRPPSVPQPLSFPPSAFGGQNLTVTWGIAADEDGNLAGYILERRVSGGAWVQRYKGINRAFTDAITFGWETVAYRVKAYDSVGAESEYITGSPITVINNTPPSINGSDGSLGTKTGAFNQSYTVTDSDSGQTITVVEKIDGVQKRSYTAISGQGYSLSITAAEWIKLLNGSHTITITATDHYGGAATRTYTFTKNETEMELRLATPLPTDGKITKAIMSVTREIPAGATFSVEVCNNGNDASPTWEDVTNAVVGGSKFFFSNTNKTAAAWGYNVRIKVKRNSAAGECFIVSAGGNFE